MSERGSHSRSKSNSPEVFVRSRSRSGSRKEGEERGKRKRSNSRRSSDLGRSDPRSRSNPRRRSNPRSRSDPRSRSNPRRRSNPRSRSNSRSRSDPRRGRSNDRDRPQRRESRSPSYYRDRRQRSFWEEAEPNTCLGVFGLSFYTTEKELEKEFGKFGLLQNTQLVLDNYSGRSRGFAFVSFENIKDASAAREALNGLDLDGRKIRVEYSLTKRPHSPTPGIYMGRDRRDRGGRGRGRGRGGGRGDWRCRSSGPSWYDSDRRGPTHYQQYNGGPPHPRYDDRTSGRFPSGYRVSYGDTRHWSRNYGDRDHGATTRYYDEVNSNYVSGERRAGETRPTRDYRSRSRSFEKNRY